MEEVQGKEREDGGVEHVINYEVRVALMSAANMQVPERHVTDVSDEVRMTARALMSARSVGWIRSRALVLGLSIKSNLVT